MKLEWDLDRIFNENSGEFQHFLKALAKDLAGLEHSLAGKADIKSLILQSQSIFMNWYQAFEYAMCLISVDVHDEQAKEQMSEVNKLGAWQQTLEAKLNGQLSQIREADWTALLADPDIAPLAFILNERREHQLERSSYDTEKAVGFLEEDGLHAWGDLYQLAQRNIRLELGGREIPIAEASGKVLYNENREERMEAFPKWKEEWRRESPLCAKALNHIAGFRLQKYELRGCDSFLKEACQMNRISEQSVDVMWNTVLANKEPFLDYLRYKKELFGAGDICWTDHLAPLPLQSSKTELSYEKAAALISESIRAFDSEAGSFIESVLGGQWIDAASRPEKAGGGFCAPMPLQKESRIMLTYEDDLISAGVLAHELGHAYHYRLLQDLPMYLQDCPQIMAETASTLFETIVMKEALKNSLDPLEKLGLLGNMITRDIGTLLNSYVRHRFEIRLYEERKQRILSAEDLNGLMIQAQKEAFGGLLDTYDPTFWASLRHFYFTRKPFGHFPYTAAHLLSTGLYSRIKDKPDRGLRLKNFLLDTSSYSAEDIIHKHLQADITKPDFWEDALGVIFENIHQFMGISRENGIRLK